MKPLPPAEVTPPKLTYGQSLVRVNFNPSENSRVKACKLAFAAEIDRLNDLKNCDKILSSDTMRSLAVAMTQIEIAAAMAVKALTSEEFMA